jgi:hypothetical protein
VLVWSSDRLARSTKHFLHALDELSELGIQFLSQRKAIDTDGPLGRAIVVIISAIAELERSLIVERVRAGMRRAKLEGRRIVRTPPDVNHAARLSGMSLTDVAKKYGLSGASIVRFVRDSQVRLAGDPPPQLVTASETVNIEEVELGFVANLETLREVLKELSINGRRWWVASDPTDASNPIL